MALYNNRKNVKNLNPDTYFTVFSLRGTRFYVQMSIGEIQDADAI